MRSTNRVRSIRIQNFQSLADVDMPLGDVTMVRGLTDVGKSAVVRALLALLNNRMSQEQIRSGESTARIEVVTDAGRVALIRNGKDGKEVSYEVQPTGGLLKVHTKCNKEVPEEVEAILGIRHFRLDEDTEIMPNLATQFGGQFPIDQPPHLVSKMLGRISNLNVVFGALRLVDSEEREVVAGIAAADRDVKTRRDTSTQFATLGLQRQSLTALGARVDQERKNREQLVAAQELGRGLVQATAEVQVAEARTESALRVSTLAEVVRTRAQGGVEAHALLADLRRVNGEALVLDQRAQSAVMVVNQLEHLTTQAQGLVATGVVLAELTALRVDHNRLVRSTKEKMAEVEMATRELEEAVNGMSVCPLIKDTWKPGCQEVLRHG